jgi:hypothetical protein
LWPWSLSVCDSALFSRGDEDMLMLAGIRLFPIYSYHCFVVLPAMAGDAVVAVAVAVISWLPLLASGWGRGPGSWAICFPSSVAHLYFQRRYISTNRNQPLTSGSII